MAWEPVRIYWDKPTVLIVQGDTLLGRAACPRFTMGGFDRAVKLAIQDCRTQRKAGRKPDPNWIKLDGSI